MGIFHYSWVMAQESSSGAVAARAQGRGHCGAGGGFRLCAARRLRGTGAAHGLHAGGDSPRFMAGAFRFRDSGAGMGTAHSGGA